MEFAEALLHFCGRRSGSFSRGETDLKVAYSLFLIGLVLGELLSDPSLAHAEDARVLPSGRFRISLLYGQSRKVSESFLDDGSKQSLTEPYKMDLSSQNLKKLSPAVENLVNFLNSWGDHYDVNKRNNLFHGVDRDPSHPKLGDALSRGFFDIEAQAQRQMYQISLQYGVTDRFGLGVQVPYIKQQIDVRYSIQGVNTANDIYDYIKSFNKPISEELLDGLNQIRNADSEAFQEYLASKGYDRFEGTRSNGWGDICFGGRYNYLNLQGGGGELLHSTQVGFTAPTGHLKKPSQLTDTDFGFGAWDASGAHLITYTPISLLTFSNGTHYTYRFPSHRPMRVRKDVNDVLPDSTREEDLGMYLGDKYWTNLTGQINISRAINIFATYEWFWKKRDRYEGFRSDRDYSYLSDRTDVYLETVNLGVDLFTLPAFLKGDFPAPIQWVFNTYIPIRGRNSVIAPFVTAEMNLYF